MKNKQKSLYSRLNCILSPTNLVTSLNKTTLKFWGGFAYPSVKMEQRLTALLFGTALFLLCNFLFLSHWASLPQAQLILVVLD